MNKQELDYAVDIFELRKRFLKAGLTRSGYSTFKSLFLKPFQKFKQEKEYITAIDDLTIRIPKGASVGVIGRNGSGKSSLLKLITGIYQPDKGHVKVNGRIAALIELGAGFHPDFTGRENLYLGAVLHGLSKKEIEAKFDEIVKFAELEDYIDQPVRTYSSGMFMRLGFSLAVNTSPDILLIDEVLAVGDAKFVGKCQDKIEDLKRQKKTLFMVSHDLSAVERWSDEVIWLDSGQVKDRGEPRRVIDHYLEFIEKGEEAELKEESQQAATETSAVSIDIEETVEETHQYERWGSREVEVQNISMENVSGEEHLLFHTGEPVVINLKYKVNAAYKDLVFGFGIDRIDGSRVIGTNSSIEKTTIPELSESGELKIIIPALNLLSGTYFLDIAVHREDGYSYDYHKNALKFSVHCKQELLGVVHLQHAWEFSQ